MPMLFTGWRVDVISGGNLVHVASSRGDHSSSGADDQNLTVVVGVPERVRPRSEHSAANPDALIVQDVVDQYVTDRCAHRSAQLCRLA